MATTPGTVPWRTASCSKTSISDIPLAGRVGRSAPNTGKAALAKATAKPRNSNGNLFIDGSSCFRLMANLPHDGGWEEEDVTEFTFICFRIRFAVVLDDGSACRA